MKTIVSIIGARPQIIKHASLNAELQKRFRSVTVHTGQHYDYDMSDAFFKELDISRPDYLIQTSGTQNHLQKINLMVDEISAICTRVKPHAILVYGDTYSTLAGAIAASKLMVPQVHVEAGLRSYNRDMPEEINRIVADTFAELLFCPTMHAVDNLFKEHLGSDRVFHSGDIMLDILNTVVDKLKPIHQSNYFFATIHRPYNTASKERIFKVFSALNNLPLPVVLPLHPGTLQKLNDFQLDLKNFANISFIPPTTYIESLSYQKFADCVITDSGGIQKEAYILKTKCITLRSETEWIETLMNGCNALIFDNLEQLPAKIIESCGEFDNSAYGNGNAGAIIMETMYNMI